MSLVYGRTRSGFALIELVVVLAIISLIIGGILVGRDMIRSAEVRSAVAQFDQFNAAVNTFQLKYKCLPGDCANGSTFGFDPLADGNGDGRIGSCNVVPCPASYYAVADGGFIREHRDFWYHLGEAGLLKFRTTPYDSDGILRAGVVTPPLRIPKIPGKDNFNIEVSADSGWSVLSEVTIVASLGAVQTVQDFSPHNFTFSRSAAYIGEGVGATSGRYLPQDMYALDKKIDDGLPLAGKVWAWMIVGGAQTLHHSMFTGVVGAQGPEKTPICIRRDTSPPQYNIAYKGNSWTGLCSVIMKASF